MDRLFEVVGCWLKIGVEDADELTFHRSHASIQSTCFESLAVHSVAVFHIETLLGELPGKLLASRCRLIGGVV